MNDSNWYGELGMPLWLKKLPPKKRLRAEIKLWIHEAEAWEKMLQGYVEAAGWDWRAMVLRDHIAKCWSHANELRRRREATKRATSTQTTAPARDASDET